MDWLGLIFISVLATLIWIACYYASAKSRIKQAEKDGKTPKLALCRIFYAVTWIIGQAFYWNMCITLHNWGGMD